MQYQFISTQGYPGHFILIRNDIATSGEKKKKKQEQRKLSRFMIANAWPNRSVRTSGRSTASISVILRPSNGPRFGTLGCTLGCTLWPCGSIPSEDDGSNCQARHCAADLAFWPLIGFLPPTCTSANPLVFDGPHGPHIFASLIKKTADLHISWLNSVKPCETPIVVRS